MPNKEILTFEEAMNLLHVGAHGFKFKAMSGGIFAVDHDENQRPKLTFQNEETEH